MLKNIILIHDIVVSNVDICWMKSFAEHMITYNCQNLVYSKIVIYHFFVIRYSCICGCRNTITNNVSYRRSFPYTNMVGVGVYYTSMTDIVVEKWIVLTVDLTRTFIYKNKHILDGTQYIYQYGLSCVSKLPQEKVD